MLNKHDQLQNAIKKTRTKVKDKQKGITTFFDNVILQEGINYLNSEYPKFKNTILERSINTLNVTDTERFIKIPERIGKINYSDLDGYSRICSQGVNSVFHWHGKPLFKSVYDQAIYQMMINEIKPATIIEIGSTEASLNWLRDMCDINSVEAEIIGIDRIKPENLPRKSNFIQGNIQVISALLPVKLINTLPHPFLIIEDAHVHLEKVLEHLSKLMLSSDYLVIEDSFLKQQKILNFANKVNGYYIDTYYTDFFGINSTTAANSILTKKSSGNM